MRILRLVCLTLVLWAPAAKAMEIRVTVEEPAGVDRSGWPVTSGIPLLAKGALKDARGVALFTPDGRTVPLQTEALSRWPDGSVRWLLLDFQIDLEAGEKKKLVLRHGPDTERSVPANPVRAGDIRWWR